ncbi:hypothetical protein [Deinococcus cellulosilyticus]|uniref:Uncharacterized protein n=1 Tax=Deinococcus cellulosilyticus (strain DSM 18568 / NBRC 106333 / KACC 11606 / 5516J-15) TaxID=1223518 RepID=A0A511N1P1_DEIC1|nr:hypothetical protein [Deinococcus cellulosilyticus]GEM46427.1 hypothetical protein DC3_20620 [Deinococcus cellulosilyticus NBRC 106333 = KACC 11606]
MKRLALSLIAFSALAGTHAQTLIENYHPAPQAKRIPVETCARSQASDAQTLFTCSRVRVVHTHQNVDNYDESPEVLLEMPRGITLSVKMDHLPYFAGEAYQTDLNNDNRTDLIVTLPWGGLGLGGERAVVVFAVSNGEDYVLSAIDSMSFGPASLIRNNGQNLVLHSAFVNTRAIDNRDHSFFVYSPLKIDHGVLKVDSSQEKVWIQYKFKPNSTPTKLLTRWQKTVGWNQYLKWTTEDRMIQGIFRNVQ